MDPILHLKVVRILQALKNPAVARFLDFMSLLIAAIVAQLCQACLNYSYFWPVFNCYF
jgi:riboflavin transporter FmnP